MSVHSSQNVEAAQTAEYYSPMKKTEHTETHYGMHEPRNTMLRGKSQPGKVKCHTTPLR